MSAQRKSITIPLGVPAGPNARREVERRVAQALAPYAADGWEPDQPTDFDYLSQNGLSESGSVSGGNGTNLEYESVEITLRRGG